MSLNCHGMGHVGAVGTSPPSTIGTGTGAMALSQSHPYCLLLCARGGLQTCTVMWEQHWAKNAFEGPGSNVPQCTQFIREWIIKQNISPLLLETEELPQLRYCQ